MLLGILCGLAGCSLVAPKFERPALSVVSVQLTGGNLLQQNFLVRLDVQNPNDRAIPVTSLHAELTVAGDRIATGVSDRAFVVPARGEAQFDLTMTANMALALLKIAGRSDRHSNSVDYDLTGEARLDLPFLRDVPFRQNGSFALPSM